MPMAGLSFEKMSLSASRYRRPFRPSGRSLASQPTFIAHFTSLAFTPVASLSLAVMPAWNFSQMRGTPKKMVGCTSLRFSGTASIDSAKYTRDPVLMGT